MKGLKKCNILNIFLANFEFKNFTEIVCRIKNKAYICNLIKEKF